jgi:hypothetical protein
MKLNRRGRRSYELLTQPGATDQLNSSTAAPASSSDDAASKLRADSDAIARHLERVVEFQRSRRQSYVALQASQSEKLFSELMDEEESSLTTRRKKPAKAKAETQEKKGKKANKKKAQTNAPAVKADADAEPTSPASADSAASSPSSSPRLSAVPTAVTASPSLSPNAAPFVPLSSDAATTDTSAGWEVVGVKPPKQAKSVKPAASSAAAASPAAAASHAVATTAPAAASAGEKPSTSVQASPKRKAKPQNKPAKSVVAPTSSPSSAPSVATTQAAPAAVTVGAAATALATPLLPAAAAVSSAASVPAPPLPSTRPPSGVIAPPSYTLVPVQAPAHAPAAHQMKADPAPSSSFFAAFTTRPRAWRPITQLQPRRQLSNSVDSANAASASPTAASSTAADAAAASSTLSSLQAQFASLHPHIESTDLQLQHMLGADWSSLSMSQLSLLDELYAQLTRQIRDTQFQLLAAQQQDLMSELVRTKSDLHALRKDVVAMASSQTDGKVADAE